jgi:anti-sigma regulatory factor (Ser/Thr protein kinase)
MMPDPGEHRLELPSHPSSVGIARHFVDEILEPYDTRTVEDARLVVSELVTGALVHGGGIRWVSVVVDVVNDVVRIAVADNSTRPPLVAERGSAEAAGLRVVALLVDRWGAEYDELGKEIWCEMQLRAT